MAKARSFVRSSYRGPTASRAFAPSLRSRAVSLARSASPSTVVVVVVVERDGCRFSSTCWPDRRRPRRPHLRATSTSRGSTIGNRRLSTTIDDYPCSSFFKHANVLALVLATTSSTLVATNVPPPRPSGEVVPRSFPCKRPPTSTGCHTSQPPPPSRFLLRRRLPIHRTRPPASSRGRVVGRVVSKGSDGRDSRRNDGRQVPISLRARRGRRHRRCRLWDDGGAGVVGCGTCCTLSTTT